MAAFSARKSQRQRQRAHDDKERYYLLPGQGGSSYRRKQRFILKAAIIVGVLVSLLFAGIMYVIYRSPR